MNIGKLATYSLTLWITYDVNEVCASVNKKIKASGKLVNTSRML